jgi:hypothetical protein
MPGQRLDYFDRRVALGERGNESVTEGVKVGEPFLVLVFDAGHGQIAL